MRVNHCSFMRHLIDDKSNDYKILSSSPLKARISLIALIFEKD